MGAMQFPVLAIRYRDDELAQ